MRHRESPTALEALEAWKALRRKVEAEGGQHYDRPVLVRFGDKGTFEVMDRDIVEDEFYVRRPYKVIRELDPKGADLEQALREQRGGDRDRSRPGGRPGQRGRPGGGKPGQGGSRHRRGGRSRRGSRRGGDRGPRPPRPPQPPPAA
ncbi:MAG: hypothetical protein HS108_01405 [Planctomycetes bacterium]|nr:hypothetical protein [Planctomycetota bacterium]